MATKVGGAYVEISTRDSKLVAGLDKAQKNVGASMKAIGRNMAIAGAAITAGFAMAIKTAAQFEQSMANTASVAGATAEELIKLSNYARKMGEQSVFSASQAADAMYFLGSAGMSTEEIMGALEGTLALAAATASDLAYTSESVAATLSQFALDADEAGRVANVFAAAISGSQATMDKLSTSMSYVGPMAKSMGMEIEDTVGILMNLYNAGLDGSKAGTALRMAFVKLIEPTEDGAIALEKLEVAIKDSKGEMRPFKDIIDDLGKVGMSTADAMDIFGIRAGPAMMALVSQGTGAIQEMTDAVTGTEKASEMATMQIDTFEGAMKLLRSAFEELQITLVKDLMPNLKGLIEKITEGIKKVSEWMKENPKLTETIVKWGAAIGALMVVLGPLLMILPGLVTAIGFLLSPIGLVVVAVAALAIAWKTNFMGIQDKTKVVIEFIKGLFKKFVGFVDDSKDRLAKIIKVITKVWDNLKSDTKKIWDGISRVIGLVVDKIRLIIEKMVSAISKAWGVIKSIIDGIKKILREGITVGPETAPGWEPGGAGGFAGPSPSGFNQAGIPYISKKGFYGLDVGERVLTKEESITYNQQKSYASSINIQPGAIQIVTPKFGGRDAKEMIRLIKREAKMQGLEFATV